VQKGEGEAYITAGVSHSILYVAGSGASSLKKWSVVEEQLLISIFSINYIFS